MLNVLQLHGWEIYLMIVLSIYISFTSIGFWIIYIPTFVLVAITKSKIRTNNDNS